jgi:hypothetical protein
MSGRARPTVADAAERILIACRESGQDHVVTSSGVWAVAWLDDDEVVEFAAIAVAGLEVSHDIAAEVPRGIGAIGRDTPPRPRVVEVTGL